MKCNSKWLSLYLDGELDQGKKRKLEEHLRLCEACAERLEELKELEALAARDKLPQVSEAYWETFSARVRNKLLLREREPGSDSFWKKLKGAFQISPFRLKLAGAAATIIIAAWIGSLYIDYSPTSLEKQLPSQNLNLPQKAAAPPESTLIPSGTFSTEKDQDKSKEAVKIQTQRQTPGVSQPAQPGVEVSSIDVESTDKAASVELPTEKVTAKKPVIEKGENANLRRITSKEIESLPVKSVDELLSHQLEFAAAPSSLSTDTAGKLHTRGGSAPAMEDTLSAISITRKQIEELENFLVTQPADSLQERAYQDLAQSYLNLCLLTKDKKDIDTGLMRIQDIQRQYLYPSTRTRLSEILEKIRALERSPE